MVLSPVGLRHERDCTSNSKLQAHPLIKEGATIANLQLSKENFTKKEKLVMGPDGGLTLGQTGLLTVGRKITLTLRGYKTQCLGV
jgi:hypothetical protein